MSEATYTLPDLPYAYDALEPAISKQIMELHHGKHHATYVSNLNAALKSLHEVLEAGDIPAQIDLHQSIKFNGGGHINHALFWENLAPPSSAEASNPVGSAPGLVKQIEEQYGGLEAFKQLFNKAFMGIQGSGWAFLVRNIQTGRLSITTTKDQDPVHGSLLPIICSDAWEHSWYLAFHNEKARYAEAFWTVVNWKTAEARWNGNRQDVFKSLRGKL